MKKLYISLLISAIFLISAFPQTSYAEEENNYYDIEDSRNYCTHDYIDLFMQVLVKLTLSTPLVFVVFVDFTIT